MTAPAAFIITHTAAFRGYIDQNKIIPEYMKEHRQSWYDLATQRGFRIPHIDDLVLISGFVKTTGWVQGYLSGRDAQNAEFRIKGV